MEGRDSPSPLRTNCWASEQMPTNRTSEKRTVNLRVAGIPTASRKVPNGSGQNQKW